MTLIQDLYLFLIFFFFILLLKIALDFFLKNKTLYIQRFHREKFKGFGAGLLTKKKNPEVKDTTHICKKCGSVMIKRQNHDMEFYGCSNFPKCKFTIK
jgi:hypothetical protein